MAKKLSSFYEVGEIRPARDSDFQHFINLIDDGKWTQKMDKDGIIAWARNMENTSIKMFKVRTWGSSSMYSLCRYIIHCTCIRSWSC